ncbi:MAG: phosphate ABC transporter ATP-binding protein [Pseudanabaena sp.]|nr:MAG: phosphate ABC transporter ATP-binding protein [Pseudanabaena sp.]
MNANPYNSIETDMVFRTENVNIYYGRFLAVKEVNLEVPKNAITAFIGPSGCGKSTVLRCFNRLNDLIKSFHLDGKIFYHGQDLYAPNIDAVEVRRQIGMVFQQPNPFPKTIYDNIAFGPRLLGYKGDMDELVESSLRRGALWDDVKDKLKAMGTDLSGGQQQRLCIARAISVQPEVILMDEPCAALDPLSTLKIEELMQELKKDYTLIIVTHNMQQAARSSDYTAFFNVQSNAKGQRTGFIEEYNQTSEIFESPQKVATRDYVSGRFG